MWGHCHSLFAFTEVFCNKLEYKKKRRVILKFSQYQSFPKSKIHKYFYCTTLGDLSHNETYCADKQLIQDIQFQCFKFLGT